jgi:hypothetical protein
MPTSFCLDYTAKLSLLPSLFLFDRPLKQIPSEPLLKSYAIYNFLGHRVDPRLESIAAFLLLQLLFSASCAGCGVGV